MPEPSMRKWRESLFGLLAILGALSSGCGEEPRPPENQPPSYRGITLKVGALGEPGLLVGVTAHRG
jgi:hypothetical protein